MRCSTLLAILTVVLLYLVMGALVFRTLEASKERIKYDELLSARTSFLHNHTCVSPDALQELIQHVVSAIDSGVDASSSSNFTSRWDLSSAFFFCGTIITTIGFGNLSPKTEGGQLFCIFYALIGIPMFGILLAGVGDQLGTMLRRAVGKIETLFLRKGVKPTSVRIISAIFSILIGCLIFLGVPTLVFQEVEQWSLLEAGYFVVITLTTVGFGDYVADDRRHGSFMYKPIVWLWIVFGLAYFASILTMIGNWLRVLSKKTRAEVYGGTESPRYGLDTKHSEHVCGLPHPSPEEAEEDTTPHPSLLDFFGENLAYIDESSDTLSDRVKPDSTSPHPPRKPKRRSMRRQLPNRSLLVMKRVYSSELQPPSNPPTPPPQVPS
uniref:Potassium channel subfamily K member 4 n=1 Tax=Denticeps clupeoides TaxID=299321 RepID=A0AAY4CPT2_9TELE